MKFIITFCIVLTYSFAGFIKNNNIDFTKSIIQLATYKTLLNKDFFNNISEKYSVCLEKDNNRYVLYAVNINNKNKKNIKKELQKRYSDSYFVKKSACITLYDKNKIKVTRNTKHKINNYKIALQYFKNNNYEISYRMLKKLYIKNKENLNINYYLGRSSFEIKNYDEALNAFDRFLIQKPNTPRVELEVAKTYFYQKEYEKSKIAFAKLQKKKLPKNVLTKIEIFLLAIESKRKKSYFDSVFIFGASYDDNINNRADSNMFFIPKFNTTYENTTKDISSFSNNVNIFFNHKYRYMDNMDIKNSVLFYMKKVFKDTKKNVQFFSYSPSVNYWYNNNLIIDFNVFTDFMKFESEYYMHTYGTNPQVRYIQSKDLSINFDFKYQKKKNKISDNKNKNSAYTKLKVGFNKIINKKISLNSSLFYENEKKDSGLLTNIDYSMIGVSINPNYKYTNMLHIQPTFIFRSKKYKNENSFYLKKQTNKEYIVGLGALYILNKNWVSQFNLIHNRIKSNIVSSEYTKNILNINFIRKF